MSSMKSILILRYGSTLVFIMQMKKITKTLSLYCRRCPLILKKLQSLHKKVTCKAKGLKKTSKKWKINCSSIWTLSFVNVKPRFYRSNMISLLNYRAPFKPWILVRKRSKLNKSNLIICLISSSIKMAYQNKIWIKKSCWMEID